jgi:hypothetical protein
MIVSRRGIGDRFARHREASMVMLKDQCSAKQRSVSVGDHAPPLRDQAA